MGAEFFMVEAWGTSPELAFDKIRQEYGHQVGYAGYSGTIVEKNSFIIFPLPEGADPEAYAQKIAEEDLKEAQVTGIKITKKKVGNERYDNLARAIVVYSIRGCSTGACYGMYHTLEEAEEAAKDYAVKYLEKVEIKKEVVAPSDTLFVYEPENADECLGHYLFFGYAPY